MQSKATRIIRHFADVGGPGRRHDAYMPRIQASVRAVLSHPDGARVASVRGALPQVQTDTNTRWGQGVTEAFQAALGVPLALVRLLDFQRVSDTDELFVREAVWQLDALSEPDGVDWVFPDQLPDDERAFALSALAPAPPVRPDWQRSGWFASALAWLDEQLARLGRTRTGTPEVLKHWQISWLLRVPTDQGNVYLKSVPPFFAREIWMTAWLDRTFPGSVPPVLALDERRRLLLMDHAGDHLPEGDLAPYLRLARTLARLQRGTEAYRDELQSLGLADHGPAWVLAELPGLFQERYFLRGEERGLTSAEIEQLLALRPRLEAACGRLAASPIPITLGHGDLHLGNVVSDGEHVHMLDWSDACLTHPFLDVSPASLLPEGASAVQRAAFRDAYLEAWTDLLPLPDLRALAADAELVAELYRALGYTLGIQPNVEGAQEWGDGHLYHLRSLLALSSGEAQQVMVP